MTSSQQSSRVANTARTRFRDKSRAFGLPQTNEVDEITAFGIHSASSKTRTEFAELGSTPEEAGEMRVAAGEREGVFGSQAAVAWASRPSTGNEQARPRAGCPAGANRNPELARKGRQKNIDIVAQAGTMGRVASGIHLSLRQATHRCQAPLCPIPPEPCKASNSRMPIACSSGSAKSEYRTSPSVTA
jgi:hypothetical protein